MPSDCWSKISSIVLGDSNLTPSTSPPSADDLRHVMNKLFGPVMTLWFLTIGVAGAAGIAAEPGILRALSPACTLSYFGQCALLLTDQSPDGPVRAPFSCWCRRED